MIGAILAIYLLGADALNLSPKSESEATGSGCLDEGWLTSPGLICMKDQRPFWERVVTTHRLYLKPPVPVATEDAKPPKVRHSFHLNGPCAWIHAVASDQTSSLAVYASKVFRAFCENCHEKPCSRRPLNKGVLGFGTDLPPTGGCIYIDQLPEFPQQEPGTWLQWELRWDYSVFAKVLGGLLLMSLANHLRENPAVHMAVGGAGFVGAMGCVLLWWLARQSRSSIALLFGGLAVLYQLDIVCQIPSPDIADWRRPIHYRHCAELLLLAGVLLGAWLGVRYFASPEDPVGEVNFSIGDDGRRIDDVAGVPVQQIVLGWLFWVAGACLLARSCQEPLASAALLVVALLQDRVSHVFSLGRVALVTSQPRHWRPLLSQDAYKMQGTKQTARALAQLSAHMRAHPEVFRKLSQGSACASSRF